jgi:hypothetical protein
VLPAHGRASTALLTFDSRLRPLDRGIPPVSLEGFRFLTPSDGNRPADSGRARGDVLARRRVTPGQIYVALIIASRLVAGSFGCRHHRLRWRLSDEPDADAFLHVHAVDRLALLLRVRRPRLRGRHHRCRVHLGGELGPRVDVDHQRRER